MSIPIEHFNRSSELVTAAVADLLALGADTQRLMAERDDVAAGQRLHDMVTSVVDGPMRVVVVGEHKSGKSTLVNALLGQQVLATDPLVSTALPSEVRFGEERQTFVDLERDGQSRSVRLGRLVAPGDELDAAGTTPAEARGIRIQLPSPLLASGLTLLDTPSMSGGIGSATAASVLAELVQSQAWILTSDASQELTGPELELVRVGCSLCPIVIVVATKCDLAADWHRIVDINLGHLARLDLPVDPVIIPTAAPLRNAAVRLGEPHLDRESGLPLLTWYLTRTTTVTARAAIAISATNAMIAELEGLDRAVTDEIDVIVNSGDRARILAESQQARDSCERLTRRSRPAVDRATRSFQREVQRDLQDRIEALRRETMDDLARLEGERQWPKIEQRTQTEVNRLLAEHLQMVRESIQSAIDAVAAELAIDRGDIDIAGELALSDSGGEQVTGQLDPPEIAGNHLSRLQPLLMSARVGVTSASGVGIGLSSGLLVGVTAVAGVALVPIAALGAGWWVRQRSKAQEQMPWRRQAEIELNRFLTDSHQVISRSSEDLCDDVLGQLPALLEQRLRSLGERLAGEFERLTALADDRHNMHRTQIEGLEERRDEIRLRASQARRLLHQLESPVIALPLHIGQRRPSEGTLAS